MTNLNEVTKEDVDFMLQQGRAELAKQGLVDKDLADRLYAALDDLITILDEPSYHDYKKRLASHKKAAVNILEEYKSI